MRFHAGLIGGVLSLAALGAGCGDDGGGVVTNSKWRLWTDFSVSYSNHVYNGGDGLNDNTAECSYDGERLVFMLRDAGKLESGGFDPNRFPGEIEVLAYPSQNTCLVQVTEAAKPDRDFQTKHEDTCDSGCRIGQFSADESTGILAISLACNNLIMSGGGSPLVLAGVAEPGSVSRTEFATFEFQNCF